VCFALIVWFAWTGLLAGITKTVTGKACNACETVGRLGLNCVKILGCESSYPNRRFLDSDRSK